MLVIYFFNYVLMLFLFYFCLGLRCDWIRKVKERELMKNKKDR